MLKSLQAALKKKEGRRERAEKILRVFITAHAMYTVHKLLC